MIFTRCSTVTLDYFKERNLPYYHKLRHTGYLRHLLVRKAVKTGEILVDLVTTTQIAEGGEAALLAGWKDALCAAAYRGTLTGVLHTRNDSGQTPSKTRVRMCFLGRIISMKNC